MKPPLLYRDLPDSTSGKNIAFQEPATDESRKKFSTLLCVVTFWVAILAVAVIISQFRLRACHTSDIERVRRVPVSSNLSGSSVLRLLEMPWHDRPVVTGGPPNASLEYQTSRPLPFQTSIFRNSHFNTAHFQNPDFQPEEWCSEDDYITVSGSKPGHGAKTTSRHAREQTTALLDHGTTSSIDAY